MCVVQLFSKLRRLRHIPPGYCESFERARMTFQHQRVFCHLTQVRLLLITRVCVTTLTPLRLRSCREWYH